MKNIHMTTRRWLTVIGLVAIFIWATQLLWRRHEFLKLAKSRMQAIEAISNAEQTFVGSEKLAQEQMRENEREIEKLRKELKLLLSDPIRQDIIESIRMLETQNQDLRASAEFNRKAAEEFATIRSRDEVLVRKYKAAADHPWIPLPFDD